MAETKACCPPFQPIFQALLWNYSDIIYYVLFFEKVILVSRQGVGYAFMDTCSARQPMTHLGDFTGLAAD